MLLNPATPSDTDLVAAARHLDAPYRDAVALSAREQRDMYTERGDSSTAAFWSAVFCLLSEVRDSEDAAINRAELDFLGIESPE